MLTDSFIIVVILDTHADDWTKDYTRNVHKCSSMGSVVAYCYLLVVVVMVLYRCIQFLCPHYDLIREEIRGFPNVKLCCNGDSLRAAR